MLHYSCDLCKRAIDPHADIRHVVKIEVFQAVEDESACGCQPADADATEADHLDEMQELLERLEDSGDVADLDDDCRSLRFDLCDACRRKFLRNPLGASSGKRLDFSNN